MAGPRGALGENCERTVGELLENCGRTVGELWENCRRTVGELREDWGRSVAPESGRAATENAAKMKINYYFPHK